MDDVAFITPRVTSRGPGGEGRGDVLSTGPAGLRDALCYHGNLVVSDDGWRRPPGWEWGLWMG